MSSRTRPECRATGIAGSKNGHEVISLSHIPLPPSRPEKVKRCREVPRNCPFPERLKYDQDRQQTDRRADREEARP